MCNQNMEMKKKFIYRSTALVVTMLLLSLSCILVSAAAVDVTPLTTAINDYKTKKQASQPDVAKLTKERDDALRKLQERDNMELLRSKGVPQDYLEFAAFKINALVDDKTTFEKAAEKWLKENPRYTGSGYHVASSSTAGNTQGGSGSSNASINDRIRAAARR